MLEVVLLVDEDVIADYFAEQAVAAFLDGAYAVTVLPEVDGQPGAREVHCIVSEQTLRNITSAEAGVNQLGGVARVRSTETPPKSIPDNLVPTS